MTATVRALCAALIVIVAASAGALYVGYRSGVQHAAQSSALQIASIGSLGDVLAGSQSGPKLVDIAVRQIEQVYYRPLDPQVMLDGEHKALLAYLKYKHVANVTLPTAKAVGDVDADAQSAEQTLNLAESRYGAKLGTSGSSQMVEWALAGIATMPADPYTEYLSPRDFTGLTESLSGGNFGGVGVYINLLRDRRVMLAPIAGMPASNAGVKPGDILLSVNGKSIVGVPLDTVEQMIRGTAGTTVRLRVYPYASPKVRHNLTIVRQIIHVPTVSAKMENGYDYIRLSDFGTTSADEVHKALLDGQAHHAKGYILDLRDNGGGLVDAAVKISSIFVPGGGKTIVSTIDRDGDKIDAGSISAWNIPNLRPLAILVNKYTASASEITSGALQDYHLATIVGTKTFGKGVVQSIYSMPDGGALKITTDRYVTPLGRDIQHRGITPNITVPQDADMPGLIDSPSDKQLAAAKHLLAREH